MRALALWLFFGGQALAMGTHPSLDARERALQAFLQGDSSTAQADYQALASRSRPGRRAWLAYEFESGQYAALAAALSQTSRPEELGLRARAQADLGDWQGALHSLEGLSNPEAQMLRAEALDSLGSTMAAGAWESVLALGARHPFAALANYRAALYALRVGDTASAESRFRKAQELEPSLFGINERLAELYAEGGEAALALRRLQQILRVHPDDAESQDCLKLILRENPGLRRNAKAQAALRQSQLLSQSNPEARPLLTRTGETLLRIGILEASQGFKFRLGSDSYLQPLGLTLAAGSVWSLTRSAKSWRLAPVSLSPSAASGRLLPEGSYELFPSAADSTLVIFDVHFGSGFFWAGQEDRSFRGNFEFRCEGAKGLSVIDRLPLDDYLLGVLPAEMPVQWPKEALLAQAIVARTNSLNLLGRHGDEGFDLCSEVHCQMYRGSGEEERVGTWAVTATAGEVLERDGRLVDCRYMNSSGGHTQNSWEAWPGEAGRDDAVFDGEAASPWASRFPLDPAALLDYLDDPLDDVRPWSALAPGSSYSEYRWVLRLSPAELGEALAKRHPVGQVLGVFPMERSRFGFVQRLLIHGSNADYLASSDYVRGAIPGLRSNLFYVETRYAPSGEALEFLFHGGGWGHGVGFSQAGAAGMAASGKSKDKILKYYFPGSRIVRRY